MVVNIRRENKIKQNKKKTPPTKNTAKRNMHLGFSFTEHTVYRRLFTLYHLLWNVLIFKTKFFKNYKSV